ncbi:MAG: hypothetical protein IKV97_02430 [Clostridia bacterium]|nr:hypothetical protein [Clostridia bacterium]
MGYLKELESMTPACARKFLDLRAQGMKNAVISAKNYLPKNERVIYVSNDGDDANDGRTPCTAIATIARVNEITLPCDTVLFRRGDHFRGRVNVKEGTTYSAYGEGVKPIIDGSPKNYAQPSLWEKTDAENVWHLTEKAKNVGLVHIDPEYTYGQYNEVYGTMKIFGQNGFSGYADLKADLEFYSDYETEDFYIYSEENPGDRFLDLELATSGNIFSGSAGNVTIDNLWITHTGSHGVGSGTTKNRTVTNCVFSWLGGSILSVNFRGSGRPVRYGNAVEIYGGCDGYRVENNWMYQIYDTAVTHQFSGGDMECHQHNVRYINNLMEYCFWFIEYYNGDCKGHPQSIKNIYMRGNFCRMGGYGWGCKGREAATPMFCGSSVYCETENFVAENNIFYQSLGYLVVLANCEGHKTEIMRNNVYVNPKGANFARLYNEIYTFDGTEKDIMKNILHEEDPTVVYMPKPAVRF